MTDQSSSSLSSNEANSHSLISSFISKSSEFLWRNISMEATVSESHRISKKNLCTMRKWFFWYCVSVWAVGQTEHAYVFFENLTYLTHWGLLINILYFYLAYRVMQDKEFERKFWKTAHVLFEVGFSIQLVIALMYWVAIYSTIKRERTLLFFYQTISEHGGMYLVLVVDKIFNNIKFYKRHTIFLFAFVVLYLSANILVTVLYQPVYEILCWKKPFSYILAVGCIVASILHFSLGKLYYDFFKMNKIEVKHDSSSNEISDNYATAIHDNGNQTGSQNNQNSKNKQL